MKDWILFLVEVNPRLERLCRKADRYIESVALAYRGEVSTAFPAISRLIDKKVRFVNLRVLYGELEQGLSEDDMILLRQLASGESLTLLTNQLHLSRATLYRRSVSCLQKAARILHRNGYDEQRMKNEFGDLFERAKKSKQEKNERAFLAQRSIQNA